MAKSDNQEEALSYVEEAKKFILGMYGKYDPEEARNMLASAVFLLDEDAGHYEGLADNTPSGG